MVLIDNANNFLENADNADCDVQLIRQMKGEALFLRGYYHFLLTAYWGDVPLRLSSTKTAEEVHIPRTASSEVYTSAIKDMKESLDMVADISEHGFGGRVSKQAVKGILARVCLNAAGRIPDADASYYYTEARTWAKSLMDGVSQIWHGSQYLCKCVAVVTCLNEHAGIAHMLVEPA